MTIRLKICKHEWQSKQRGKLASNYKHGKSKGSKFKCLMCGKEGVRRSYMQKYCTTICQMNYEYDTGVRDKFEITKKANEIRRKGPTTQNFRTRVFASNIPKVCAMCNSTSKLEAHHIMPQEYSGRHATGKGDHSLSNAMILCKKCHDLNKKVV